ncbi:hypothetical protein Micbo1qcDRAFT_235342 [Microdochium bolleyi]|uniref:SWR1-complex protein 3 domain-containing protein n=1 Tax=Microdochium bolleyi TaxID=196109 RepID=A0A136IXE0_9PEZI|nr:hypothetical protein Micbo1qcDRAFT_235342 [Microdochium bolleyi]
MERKRKLPARAAARVEHVSKKRTSTPPADRSLTPKTITPQPEPEPEPEPEAPRLPTSISAATPLPTVDKEQLANLSNGQYQSVQESGVLSESLSRSRQKWIHEGIFEKYWTKPTKRKGVVKEEPNNPPKDSMVKIGSVTITIEPHVIEATMFAVKNPKPPMAATSSAPRPVVQYGPPHGTMPPPPTPKNTLSIPTKQSPAPELQSTAAPSSQLPSAPDATPVAATVPAPLAAPEPTKDSPRGETPATPANPGTTAQPVPSPATAASAPTTSLAATNGVESGTTAPQAIPSGPHTPVSVAPAAVKVEARQPQPMPPRPAQGLPVQASPPMASPGATIKPATPQAKAGPSLQPGADPIIVILAEKASNDPQLRDLMKRVAVGEASPAELKHFQGIIDQITIDYKKKNPPNPKAEALVVTGTGKTVKYFADEVRNILNIVLSSNPHQRSFDLKVPPNSDPLVIHLVKKALDNPTLRESIFRAANGRTQQVDATEIKAVLENFMAHMKQQPQAGGNPGAAHGQSAQAAGSAGNIANQPAKARKPSQSNVAGGAPTQQALRSKGPPPAARMDISAVVFEFAGGSSDRYMFPKFSILEQTAPHEVIASFLIVRKGSNSEYGGDPALDYYQPVTIRLNSMSGKHLDHFFRVVAPAEEVQRYMNDVMDNMTRAEYVLLAMRLPRSEKDTSIDETTADEAMVDVSAKAEAPGVFWLSKPAPVAETAILHKSSLKAMDEDEHYQKFISTVS